jgi:hypothetical protein
MPNDVAHALSKGGNIPTSPAMAVDLKVVVANQPPWYRFLPREGSASLTEKQGNKKQRARACSENTIAFTFRS